MSANPVKMKPSELCKIDPLEDRANLFKLEGQLVGSGEFSHMIDDKEFKIEPCFGVLLPHGFSQWIESLHFAMRAGTSVNFLGRARALCEVQYTGYRMLPYRMLHVYRLDFEEEVTWGKFGPTQTLLPKHMLHDVWIKPPDQITAPLLTSLRPFFDPNLTVMELKTMLQEKDRLVLTRSHSPEALASVKALLNEFQVEHKAEFVPRGWDWMHQG